MAPRDQMLTCAAAVVGLGCAAEAQTPQVVHSLTWSEVYAGTRVPVMNPNGLVDPGEAALVSLSISFTPAGTPVSYQSPAPGGVAPVVAFNGSTFNILATGAVGSSWSNLAVRPGFEGFLGGPGGDGNLALAFVAQPSQLAPWVPDPANPLAGAWQAVWTPGTYAAGLAQFQMEGLQPAGQPPWWPELFVGIGRDPNGNAIFGLARAMPTWASVQIPVAPAPGSAATLGLSLALTRRRRTGI